jgi:DNA-binding LytR/AlgR family response regulator
MIDKDREEEVIVYAHKRDRLTEEIERLVQDDWVGYSDNAVTQLTVADIYCFTVEDNKIYAVTDNGKWQIKQRLYQIEEQLPDTFVRINQSCLANIRGIERFDVSFGAALTVIFKNGYRDYVSRRQVKTVKERLGIK